jgi:histone deacetylase 11
MIIYYNEAYNIDFGCMNKLHPFDGLKYRKVVRNISALPDMNIQSPNNAVTEKEIDEFVDWLLQAWLHKKRYVLRALELPFIPLIPFSWIDHKILLPMRWGVGGTITAAKAALQGKNGWNLSGGYHHASAANAEGFCIYNDIGITVLLLRKENLLNSKNKILLIDIDAHHGNGNAYTFMEDVSVTILDIYNNDIYPQNSFTKERVNINIPLKNGTNGAQYLQALQNGLNQINNNFSLAFVIAGTDVVSTDPLGKLNLTFEECVERDGLVLQKLKELSIPWVFLGGGGYSKESSNIIASSITNNYKI